MVFSAGFAEQGSQGSRKKMDRPHTVPAERFRHDGVPGTAWKDRPTHNRPGAMASAGEAFVAMPCVPALRA